MPAPLVPAAGEAADFAGKVLAVAEITLRTAIDAHLRWKDSLEHYVHGSRGELLTPEKVAADDQCLLGKWIYGPGMASFGQSALFRDLRAAHARFHQQAAGVVAAVHGGNLADANERLMVGEYPRTSAEVKILVARLYVEALCALGQAPVAEEDD